VKGGLNKSAGRPLSGEGPQPLAGRALIVRRLGRIEYREATEAMQALTDRRGPQTADEIWLLEHPPVYTIGLRAREQPLAGTLHGIPLIKTDRGGDLTYHGPGQLIAYVMMDLARAGIGIRELVRRLEQTAIDVLAARGIRAQRCAGAPGVYVNGEKIASLGLRVRRGASYHGLAFNVDMDLAAFSRIDPCGYPGLKVTSLKQLGVALDDLAPIADELLEALVAELGYNGAPLETRHSLYG
jgi:lipoyl(octanoyl) transferase